MPTISVEWTIEHLDKIDDKGRPMSKVIETYLGADHDPRTFFVPSALSEALVRTRRSYVQRLMSRNGGIKLLLN